MPGATLTRKSQCQENVWVIQPPTSGPHVGARTASIPAMVVANACRRCGNSTKTAAKTEGINTPPANPCNTRAAISGAKPLLMAQAIDARVKTLSASE